jgi:urea transport system ATP-binding protein
MAVVLVEQYYDFARSLGDRLAIMVRGEVALAGPAGELDEEEVRSLLTV